MAGAELCGLGDVVAQEHKESETHLFLFQRLPPSAGRQPFKRGKSLEEPSLPPPEGGPHAWCRKHKGAQGEEW